MRDKQAAEERIAWHAFDSATLLERLRSDAAGLSDEDAARRLEEFGPNRLPERPPRRRPSPSSSASSRAP